MTKEEYRQSCLDVVYLAACAVNGETPDQDRVSGMNLANLYEAAQRHLLGCVTAMALESAGVKDEAFTQARWKAVRKSLTFDTERAAVLDRLEEAGIWYMPLKGSVLKTLYPKTGMRQMADSDILFDPTRADDVRGIMESLGFTTEHFGTGTHDVYHKPPVLNFEMHRALFGPSHDNRFAEYYADVKSRLVKDEGNAFGYRFTPEDFYIYITVHEYKHYSSGGTGLRSLLDTYVYLKKNGDTLDRACIAGELDKLGIADFEAQNRSLALHLFGGEELTTDEEEMLGVFLESGAYGTVPRWAENQVRRRGRAGYLLSRTFPSYKVMVCLYPVLKSLPVLLPVFWIWRLVRALAMKRGTVFIQLKAAFRPVRDAEKRSPES